MACRLQIIQGKIWTLRGFGGLGADWPEVRWGWWIISSGLEDSSEVFFRVPLVLCTSSQGLFPLRTQKLKRKLGQDVILSLPEIGSCDHWSGPGYCLLLPRGCWLSQGKAGSLSKYVVEMMFSRDQALTLNLIEVIRTLCFTFRREIFILLFVTLVLSYWAKLNSKAILLLLTLPTNVHPNAFIPQSLAIAISDLRMLHFIE